MKWRIAWAMVFALAVLAAAGMAKGGDKELFAGNGFRINVLRWDEPVYTISSGEPSWVRHGFGDAPFYPGSISDALHEEGVLTSLGGYYFKLTINGRLTPLVCQVINTPLDDPGERTMRKSWYVQFPAGYFSPGVYKVTGVWGSHNPQTEVNYPEPTVLELTVWLEVEP